MTETRPDFPFRIDGRGRSARTSRDDHIRDLVEQVLFTTPGERVNRPTFAAACCSWSSSPTRSRSRSRSRPPCRRRCSSGSAS
jgi:phage baseplate assembly protein W